MTTNREMYAAIDDEKLDQIERLARADFAPNQIATLLKINKAAFMRLWRDEESEIFQAYQRGRLQMQLTKMEALQGEIHSGNIIAIQTHEKMKDAADFEAWKQRIFSID